MLLHRRSLLSALGLTLPFGLGTRLWAEENLVKAPCLVRFLPFEEAVRRAFTDLGTNPSDELRPCRKVEIGHSDLVRAGVHGSHNDRPFAGFPAGHLRVVRTSSEPGPIRQGIRLYVTTVDVMLTRGPIGGMTSRPLDFATLPPAPVLS